MIPIRSTPVMVDPHALPNELLAIGAAHFMYRVDGRRIGLTGGALEAAQAAARAGMKTALLSLRGADADGLAITAALRRRGIDDLSATFLTRETPQATSTDGEMILDRALYQRRFASQVGRIGIRERIAGADSVLIDEEVPPDAIRRIHRIARDVPLVAALRRTAEAANILEEHLPLFRTVFLETADPGRIELIGDGHRIAVAKPAEASIHAFAGRMLAESAIR